MDYGAFGGPAAGNFGGAMNGFGFPMGNNQGQFGGAGYVMGNVGGAPQGGGKPANFREGDWMCAGCNSHNYASRDSCRDCRAPRSDGESSRGGGRGRSRRDRDRSYSRSRSRDRRDNRRRDRDRSHSRSRSRSRDRGGYRGGGGRDMTCYAFEKDGNCQYGSNCRFEHGSRGSGRGHRDDRRGGGGRERDMTCFAFQDGNCSRGDSCRFEHVMRGNRGGGRAASVPGAIREGDWWCKKCQVHKYAFREDCATCDSVKDGDSEAMIVQYLQYLASNGLRSNFRPGDWQCVACKGHCYGKRMDCNGCGAMGRPDAPDPELVAIFGSDDYFIKSRARETAPVSTSSTSEPAAVDAEQA